MPNQNEIQISGLSYTNKDFNTIYAELLDLVTTLTDKWDPTTSNEADPGVVLIKLGALLADKNNYNIDKNILELFPLSVSQTGNARKIYDIAGYSMKWYRSATVDVTFNYTGTLNLNNSSIDIPAYTTMVTNDDGDVVYTVLEPAALTTSIRSATVRAMQGVIKDYEVNGVTTITLDNLDEYNRLYFTETQIAENGIFIMNAAVNSTSSQFINQWERVDNLQLQELNQNLYRFGVLPNTDTCYIEFPQDISNLIGSGLLIKYIVSSGEQGNISANTLTSLYSNDITVTIDNNTTNVTEDIVISNASSTSNGEDPESLNAAYDNFKRIVGTFNTLVTCKDYETAVRELKENEQPLASNSVVSDRTNDINYSTYVVTLDPSTGASTTRVLNSACYSSSGAGQSEGMTAFELGLYALEPMGSVNADYYYNKSFSCNTDTAAIRDGLSEYKSIQHDWLTYNDLAHKFIYKNFYKLTGTVSTYYKVSSTEAEQIENNIRTAIIDRYNASELNFGEAIPFDDIVQTIQNADTRIKYVMLNEPEYTFRYMLANDYTGSFSSSFSLNKSDYLSILAKMILSGNVQLYKFNREFNYDYGQTEVNTYGATGVGSTEGISNVTTEASIVLDDGSEYQVKQNEVIELNAPSLITTTTYGTAVSYRFVKADNEEISSGNYYELGSGDSLDVSYTDTNNTSVSLTYSAGTIIQPSGFTLTPTSTNTTLSSTQSINICEINQTNFDDTFECIWFLNRAATVQTEATLTEGNEIQYYILFPAVSAENSEITQEYTLQENEYFMYTNRDRNALVILTSGTKLIRTVAAGSTGRVVQCQNYLNAGDVVSDGLSAIPSTDWYIWNYADGNLSAQEQMIITLGEGASIRVSGSGSSITLDNNEQALHNVTVEYKSADESGYTNLTQYNGANIGWSIRSRLNLNMSLTQPQVLTNTQKISYDYTEGEDQTSTIEITDCSVLSSVPLYLAGGDNIDTSSLMMDGTYSNLLRFYTYIEAVGVGVQQADTTVEAVEKSGNYYLLNSTNKYTVTFSLLPNTSCIIPIIKVGEGLTATISTSSTKLSLIEGFNIQGTQSSSVTLSDTGAYYLYLANSDSEASANVVLTISFDNAEAGSITNSLQLGDINILPGTFNGADTFSDTITKTLSYIASTTGEAVPDYENLLTYLKSYSGSNEFYYTYEIDPIDEIDTSILPTNEVGNVLAPEMMWDVNSICNKFTIAQINLSDMSVRVSNSSRV